MIKEQVVPVRWNRYYSKHYLSLGYDRLEDGVEFSVKVDDLPKGTKVKVTFICEICGKERFVEYRQLKQVGHTNCKTCARKTKVVKCSTCMSDIKPHRYVENKPYCNKHYHQIIKKGEPYRNIMEPNEFVILDSHAVMICRDKLGEIVAFVLIDIEDVDKVSKFKWRKSTKNYIKTGNSEQLYLHRLITDCQDGLEVDHINHNPLDNRKSNLRICTHKENCKNRRV